jgi:DNA-binding CsgD family transcriptional regulator
MLADCHWIRPVPVSLLGRILVEQGRHGDAERLLGDVASSVDWSAWYAPHFAFARAGLRAAQNDVGGALRDLRVCGRRLTHAGMDNPAVIPWRAEAALLHHLLGNRAEALRLAEHQVQQARRWGTPSLIGASLRVLGRVSTGAAGLALLDEAVGLLEAGTARLQLACALVDRGMVQAALGRAVPARDDMRRGAALAQQCGAHAMVQHAHRLLLDNGGRPRQADATGLDALTKGQRRVVALVGAGRTNREIADELFVSLRTVEHHLTQAFRKLGVTNRDELRRVADAGSATVTGPGYEADDPDRSGRTTSSPRSTPPGD